MHAFVMVIGILTSSGRRNAGKLGRYIHKGDIRGQRGSGDVGLWVKAQLGT